MWINRSCLSNLERAGRDDRVLHVNSRAVLDDSFAIASKKTITSSFYVSSVVEYLRRARVNDLTGRSRVGQVLYDRSSTIILNAVNEIVRLHDCHTARTCQLNSSLDHHERIRASTQTTVVRAEIERVATFG